MKTFKDSARDAVFAFLEGKILEIDNPAGQVRIHDDWLLCEGHSSE